MRIDSEKAHAAWQRGNDDGEGFPVGESEDATIEESITLEGWEVLQRAESTDEIWICRDGDLLIGVGGDEMGRGAWGVRLHMHRTERPRPRTEIEELGYQIVQSAGQTGGVDDVRRLAIHGWPDIVPLQDDSPELRAAIKFFAEVEMWKHLDSGET